MDEQRLEEMYRLVKENNRMLHAQRRNAFLGGVLKVLMWIAFLVVPWYLYMQYLYPVAQSMMGTMQQMQKLGGSAQVQMGGAEDALKKLQDQLNTLVPKKQ